MGAGRRSASAARAGRLKAVFALTLGVMFAEVIAGVISGSLALLLLTDEPSVEDAALSPELKWPIIAGY